ncbi:MAG: TraX family protein [Elainellaceae cyanobacterium]
MDQFQFKLLAALLMVIDHVGYVFFPDDSLWRVLGRLSFPLFAWLLVQGERYTRNILRYLRRLLILAVITQPFYMALFEVRQFNVLVTLAIGLSMIRLARKYSALRYLVWAVGVAIAFIVPMDAGTYGLGVILLMGMWQPSMNKLQTLRWWSFWLALHGLYVIALDFSNPIQLWAAVTPLILYAANGQRGIRGRWFYGFYPGHIVVLLGLKWLLSS